MEYTIKDVTNNTTTQLDVLLLSFEEKTDKNGKLFHNATFIDLDKNKFKVVAFNKSSSTFNTYLGKVLNVSIQGNMFNGNLTYRLLNINNILDKEVSLFCDDNKKIAEKNYNNLLKIINTIDNSDLKQLVKNIYKKYKNELLIFPAGKSLHHSELGGLIRHMLSVTELVIKFSEKYKLNKDLLIAAAALHDIGKVKEFVVEHNDIIITDTTYSKEGNLCGHLELGVEILNEQDLSNINSELILLLKHLILSHHGKRLYRSVSLPSTLEAYALFTADNLDSKLETINDAINQINPGETIANMFICDEEATHLYRPEL